MKKIIILSFIVICFIACGKREPEYPIFTHDEKVAIYKEARDHNNTEKLKEIENLMKQLETEGKKGDKIAEKERADWHTVRVLYIAPEQSYKKPDLLNGKW
ncbi:hypothetical protein HMPREF1049_1598 [Fusobacterium necrophorum subsp. funduliforme ATCC 51357]|uniref:Uncharacterized protein n=1 Tax=Fusobacterium gonidiaformans 3-1-5R TaxID=469605 RepID=E5BI18_9FUSO|nr:MULTISPECIES: hypothetical protein [Fusobacterium]EFS22141.1 hypothetical protein FSBG_01638 [Fusobacterium gonidiaformans 3-1-5R]EFS22924.1 hypothetical protein FSEG_00531 [Fusobacterium necrophorum D12]EIJ72436.1 hypothetical protein HMPREF1049_1598 [Fusobacterium necrophorum subsp. funduliforme ATCC 51357]KAB0552935.1 hypothetical protein F7P76_06115 [Fusobacterium necrophorum subsp. funduliforme]